jgi:hypothetical protein
LNPSPETDPFGAQSPDDADSTFNEWRSPYGNPYSPASATNFEAIPPLALYHPSRLSRNVYNPDWLSNPFGHYGHPYRPASLTNFEALPAPSLYNPSNLNTNLYSPDWLSSPFGHYGNPYSPNQFKDR